MTRGIRLLLGAALLATLGTFQAQTPAAAAGTVGDGTALSCTEAAFDTALLDGGEVTFDCGGAHTITLTTEKIITASTTITGEGLITLAGDPNSPGPRLFQVNASVTLILDGLTLSGGEAVNASGGAVSNRGGTLEIIDSTLTGNFAQFGGGAVDTRAGATTTITGSELTANTAGFGGALYSQDEGTHVVVTQSTLADNVGQTGSGSAGGAIYNEGGDTGAASGPLVEIVESTLFRNYSWLGGGVYNAGGEIGNASGGQVAIVNSTLSTNSALFAGGGIYNNGGEVDQSSGATVNITASTLLNNFGGIFGGNAIFNDDGASDDATAGVLTVSQTVIADDRDGASCFNAPAATFTSEGYNLDDDGSCPFTARSDRSGVGDVGLGPLASNGGSTQTHMPEVGSPAIDGGPPTCFPANDQIGTSRPQARACDIGAVEVERGAAICANQHTGIARYSTSGCQDHEITIILPDDGPVTFCINNMTSTLRYAANNLCRGYETPVVLPDEGPITVCVSNYTGLMRAVDDESECQPHETPQEIGAPPDGPPQIAVRR